MHLKKELFFSPFSAWRPSLGVHQSLSCRGVCFGARTETVDLGGDVAVVFIGPDQVDSNDSSMFLASNYKCIASSNKCLTSRNKKLLILVKFLFVTSSKALVTTSEALVITSKGIFYVPCS